MLILMTMLSIFGCCLCATLVMRQLMRDCYCPLWKGDIGTQNLSFSNWWDDHNTGWYIYIASYSYCGKILFVFAF